jgi:hypothetical protein
MKSNNSKIGNHNIINKNIPGKGATDLMWPVDYVFKVETYIIYLDVIISVDI